MHEHNNRTPEELFSAEQMIEAAHQSNQAQRTTYEKAIKLELLTTLKEQVRNLDYVDFSLSCNDETETKFTGLIKMQSVLTLISNLETLCQTPKKLKSCTCS